EVEQQVERFHAALDASRRDLQRIRDSIAAELGEEDAKIYDVHRMMLEDPELTHAVEPGIRGERRFPAYAFRRWMSTIAGRFETMQDEYLRERRADVLDVERRVLRHLVGNGSRGLGQVGQPSLIVAHDLGPSEVAMLDRACVLGFITEVGGRTSHSAIVARGRGIPAVMSVRGLMQLVKPGDWGAVDGYAGLVEINPDEEGTRHYQGRRALFDE